MKVILYSVLCLAYLNSAILFADPQAQKSLDSVFLAAPNEINLGGLIRREEMNSPIGPISLKWPRTAESSFGRTPVRAMADSARTVSRVLKSSSFPAEIQNMNVKWNVVFMDETLPEGQIPANLVSNCHPGWMTPPSNIYIVAQRVAAGCGEKSIVSASVADSALSEVLIHEMGHAVEAFILQAQMYTGDHRLRAEGFATWFEMYASQYSSFLDPQEIKSRTASLAAYSFQRSPNSFQFDGSAYDYARASLYFSAVESRFGLRGIWRLYDRMRNSNGDLMPGIEKEFSLKRPELESEALKVIGKYKR